MRIYCRNILCDMNIFNVNREYREVEVAVLGLGWLGLPLACELKKQGLAVTGTKTAVNDSKIKGIPVYPFNLYDAQEYERLWQHLNAQTVILNIPPLKGDLALYEELMGSLIDSGFKSGVKQVLFISSTSVYGSQGQVIESNDSTPLTKSGVVHRRIEQYLLTQYPGKVTILRLAGLVGDDRHPVHTLAGRTGIKAGLNYVNLIHQADVIVAIMRILELAKWGKVFHLCADEHPTRSDYYTWAAKVLLLPEPQFEMKTNAANKWIDATTTKEELALELKYPSPFNMPLNKK